MPTDHALEMDAQPHQSQPSLHRYDSALHRPDRSDAPSGRVVCTIFISICIVFIALGLFLAKAPEYFLEPYVPPDTCEALWPEVIEKLYKNVRSETFMRDSFSFGAAYGFREQTIIQACIFVQVGFGCVLLSVITSALSVSFNPGDMPNDFEDKGTLSNVSQDAAKPRGRMFAICLFTASMMMLFSQYTTWIYCPWLARSDVSKNLLGDAVFEPPSERAFRNAWNTWPYVGLMFTAAIPSLSDTSGYNLMLMLVHNIFAPLSMAMALVMETVQISYGERVYSHFWSTEPRLTYDVLNSTTSQWVPCTSPLSTGLPLNFGERLRGVLVVYAWIFCVAFLACQVYLYLPLLGIYVSRSYRLALVSFYSEITVLIAAFGLPALQGVIFLFAQLEPVLAEDRAVADYTLIDKAVYILTIRDWFSELIAANRTNVTRSVAFS